MRLPWHNAWLCCFLCYRSQAFFFQLIHIILAPQCIIEYGSKIMILPWQTLWSTRIYISCCRWQLPPIWVRWEGASVVGSASVPFTIIWGLVFGVLRPLTCAQSSIMHAKSALQKNLLLQGKIFVFCISECEIHRQVRLKSLNNKDLYCQQ